MTTSNRWLWPFELKEKLGEGAMGVVYRARCITNDREVAVKILPPEAAANKTFSARFEREVEVLKNLRHPNIVHCFGGVCQGERRFYAMELVEGGSLDALLRTRGRFTWDQAVGYGLQMCAALAFAHERGIVHRDIKPGNFLLASNGKVKLSDFGLVHISTETRLTLAGKTMGTLHYMAPEQVRGKPPVSPQTDLYALGCVLFEMISGRPPFLGDTAAEIMQQHLVNAPPRVSAYALDCPTALENLVSELLSKEPEKRPAGATVVAQRLKAITKPSRAALSTDDQTLADSHTLSAGLEKSITSGRLRVKPTWILGAAMALVILLFGWNVSSWERTRYFERSEDLWIEAYRSEPLPTRLTAARALGELGPASPRAVRALMDGLADPSPEIRKSAAAALGHTGSRAKEAVPLLMRLHKTDEDQVVRMHAGQALETIREAKAGSSWWFYLGMGGLLAAGFVSLRWFAKLAQSE